MRGKIKYSKGLRLITLLLTAVFPSIISAQDDEEIIKDKMSNFSSVVTVQTKGISTIPNLTLGKPAAIFDMKIGRKLTFEPQFRFALTGKPWAMVFWWRYNPAISKKLRMIFSTNYSFSYKTIAVASSGEQQEIIRTTRYLVGSIEPIYQVSRYIDIGLYLFYNYGIEKFITKNTWMFSFRPGFSNILVTKDIAARINPEIYYLKMDNTDGIYLNARLSVSKRNFPLAITGLINKPLKSNIPSEYDFLWNVGLSYTFNRKYIEKRLD